MIVDCLLLLLIGILASSSEAQGVKWGQAVLCLCWLFVYSSTVGPICYTIISETSSLGLRAKSVCLSRNVYNITQIIANIIEPYLINPTEANLKGETAYFWFGKPTALRTSPPRGSPLTKRDRYGTNSSGLDVLSSARGQRPHVCRIGRHVSPEGAGAKVRDLQGGSLRR